jgi:RecB family exonuclease
LVHRILERFVRPQIGRTPGVGPDDPFDAARLLALAEEEASAFESSGLAGPPAVWRVERIRLQRMLRTFARADRQWRTERGVTTVAVEQPFGPHDTRHVEVRTGRGQVVHCRGRIDRVDVALDGTTIVTDYKTGRVTPAADTDDRLDGGRAVQLPLYASALATDDEHPTEAAYWSLGERAGGVRHGQAVDGAARQALSRVVGTVADAAAAGTFPAHPVSLGSGRPSPCTFCPFTAVCPSHRARTWERVRLHDDLAPYAALVA